MLIQKETGKLLDVKALLLILLFILSFSFVQPTFAQSNSFVSIVNPIRGRDFWNLEHQEPKDAVVGQINILKKYSLPATWLLRFDALTDDSLVNILKSTPSGDEKGLFLEVNPTWTEASGVKYQELSAWHLAGSVFLTGYSPADREKLIDTSFGKFKQIFGYYPKSVGAWWIDSYSLSYMYEKYGIKAALIVADQFSTDNYQVWGQYFGTPYYPDKTNTLFPAQSKERKLPIVITQWAARDPLNGYGEGVNETTYSVQANDYVEFHELDISYFSKLLDIYTKQNFNKFGHVTIGLENSYSWGSFANEYENQINEILKRVKTGEIKTTVMSEFAMWYGDSFPDISPDHIIVADDPLGTEKKVVWFMNPYYRAGWFYNEDGVVFRDIRQYIGGQKEICFDQPCQDLKLAESTTRVLDDITFRKKWVLDIGRISDFLVKRAEDKYVLSYKNEASVDKVVEFLPRDLTIDEKMYSIDEAILFALSTQNKEVSTKPTLIQVDQGKQISQLFISSLKFLIFLILAIFIPGFILTNYLKLSSKLLHFFLAVSLGMVCLTLIAFVAGYINQRWFVLVYIFFGVLVFIFKKLYLKFKFNLNIKKNLILILIITLGTVFQSLAMAKSGWVYNFGIGFWGPIGHDGIWHQALINQLLAHVPPYNPVFSGQVLSNYHYFFNLLVAETVRLTQSSILDNLYRFYPILFSALLGLGSYSLVVNLFQNRLAAVYSLFFIYFGSSFGWVVEYLREKHFGGESAFWANQPVSFNLNPPFAISLILVIATILLFQIFKKSYSLISGFLIILVAGSLIEFKVYAGIVVLLALFLIALKDLFLRKFKLMVIFGLSFLVSLSVFLPQNKNSSQLVTLSPFWFVHSMLDLPDRVGWQRLSLAREAYFARGEWLKFVLAEGLGFVIFIVGNLGTRILSLFTILNLKTILKKDEYLFIVLMSAVSISIPTLFIQKGNPWNTIQFVYYFLFFAAIGAGVSLAFIQKKLPKVWAFVIVAFILLITPISSFTTFKSYLHATPPATLSIGELKGLEFLKKLPDGIVLTPPFDKRFTDSYDAPFPLFAYQTSSYVSAFSGKQTFIEDEFQQEILQNDFKKRLAYATTFFGGVSGNWSRQFITENDIKYIYLPRAYRKQLAYEKLNIKVIFENEEAQIYEVIR